MLPTLVAVIAAGTWGLASRVPDARSDAAPPAPTAQSRLDVPFAPVIFDGAPAAGAPGEVLANDESRFIRYTDAGGWQRLAPVTAADGSPLDGWRFFGFELKATGNSFLQGVNYPGAAAVSPRGAIAAIGSTRAPDNSQTGPWQVAVAAPGSNTPHTLPAPATGPTGPLLPGEDLAHPSYYQGVAAVAAIDETGGATGVLLAPTAPTDPNTGSPAPVTGVLHWDGTTWTREPIDGAAGYGALTPVALEAAAPDQAWLLASGPPNDPVLLFRRTVDAAGPHWARVSLAGTPFATGAQPSGVTLAVPVYPASPLTVTSKGAWVDLYYGANGHSPTSGQLATLYVDAASQSLTGSWCDLPGLCSSPLGVTWGVPAYQYAPVPYQSIAFAGPGPGTRIVTNAGNGAYAEFDGSRWVRKYADGPTFAGASAAFHSLSDGWLGGTPPRRVTTAPEPDQTQLVPTPSQRPLLAAASAPGLPVGDPGTPAIAVGTGGAVLRYAPGAGWQAETIINPGTGLRATPNLRGVAWPSPDFAIAVGDGGAVYDWSSSRGTWQADQGAPSNLTENLTGVAFAPNNPNRGYIIGLNGTLLRYDKTFAQEPLPAAVAGDDLVSIAFAGADALVVAYHSTGSFESRQATSDLLVNSGSGWSVDAGLHALLAQQPGATITAVAGLPDGGAVVAGNGFVAYRAGPGQPWHADPRPPAWGYWHGLDLTAVSVAAFRDSDGTVRALLSVTTDDAGGAGYPFINQFQAPPSPDVPPPQRQPIAFPQDAFVLRGTATGWRDEQHGIHGYGGYVAPGGPVQPDAIMSLALVGPGGSGWLVGGNAGRGGPGVIGLQPSDTSAIYRYPAGPNGTSAVPAAATAPVPLPPGPVRFVVAGGAETADVTAPGLGYAGDAMIATAAAQVNAMSSNPTGPRAVLYTGGSRDPGFIRDGKFGSGQANLGLGQANPDALAREAAFSSLFSIPFYAAPSAGDATGGSLSAFESAFAGAPGPFGGGSLPAGIQTAAIPGAAAGPGARTHYAFDSAGQSGTVRVVVVDLHTASIGDAGQQNPQEAQDQWTASVLDDARKRGIPAIVVGNAPLTPTEFHADQFPTDQDIAGDQALSAFAQLIADHGASAYFFESPQQNRTVQVPEGAANAIPSFGTGSLGYGEVASGSYRNYMELPNAVRHDNPGVLLAEIDVAHRDPVTNRAPVNVRLIPTISQLTIDPVDGTTIDRGAAALFQGLGRKPLAGYGLGQSAYVTFPRNPPCPSSRGCATSVAPEARYASSDPDIGAFVAADPNGGNRTPLMGADGKPVPSDTSGLFCAYNAGTTTVSIQAGGLSYSTRVTVLGGAPRRPCGTVPLNPARFPKPNPVVITTPSPTAPGGAPAAPPANPGGQSPPAPPVTPAPPPPAPAPPSPYVLPAPPARAALVRPLPVPAPAPRPSPVVLPPPVAIPPINPTAARPIPPAGTAAVQVQVSVFANVPAAREEREEEVAPQDVQAASAYRPGGSVPYAPLVIGVVILAAGAGRAVRRGRGGSRGVQAAPLYTSEHRSRRSVR